MKKNKRSRPKAKKARRAIPKGALLLGRVNGQLVYLTPRQRAKHVLVVGATGTGKSTFFEGCLRQDIAARHGCAVVDPNGDLFRRTLGYCCYRRAIGLPVPDIILFDPSGEWVTPFNPFLPTSGEISTQVDRRVSATLRAWGQSTGDETPRLEKWLKCIYTVLVEHGLTILEAGYLVDQDARQIRAYLAQGLSDPLIAGKLEQLSAYKPADFLNQIESVENRLMRFLCSGTLTRTMGVGTNALDYRAIMDSGAVLLVNLDLSENLSEEQQRLLGTLIFCAFFECALRRAPGSRPFYFYMDEAGLFVVPEVGRAFEQCRKRGFHMNFGFQHLAQIKAEDFKVYKSLKNNAGTKVVFAVRDREDATELADDLFCDLARPEVKHLHERLSHKLVDVRETSTTDAVTQSRAVGTNTGLTKTRGVTAGTSAGRSKTRGRSEERSETATQNQSEGESFEEGKTANWTQTENESHGWGDAQTTSHARTRGSFRSSGRTSGESTPEDPAHPGSRFSSHSDISGSSDAETHTEATTASYHQEEGTGRSHGRGQTASRGRSNQTGTSRAQGRAHGQNHSEGESVETSRAQTDTAGQTHGQSEERSSGRSRSTTDQPGTRHIPIVEKDPEFWGLDERRWMAAEKIMHQRTGECLVSIEGGQIQQVSVPLPPPFFIRQSQLARLTQGIYERHSLPRKLAEEIARKRQAEFLKKARRNGRGGEGGGSGGGGSRNGRKAGGSSASLTDEAAPTDPFDDPLGKE